MGRFSTMRLVVVAAIAHGCSASGDCTRDKLIMPPQTLEGSGTMVIYNSGGELGNIVTNQSYKMKIFQSADNDMNMVSRSSRNSVGGAMHFQVETDMILHWKAGLITTHVKTAFSKEKAHKAAFSKEHCTTIELPFFLRFLPAGKVNEKLDDLMAGLTKCIGHHDDLDQFGLSMEFPPKWLPKVLTAESGHVKFTMDSDVDAAGLLKSFLLDEAMSKNFHTTVAGKKETMPTESRVVQYVTVNKNRLGGPRPSDLMVPAKWGNCSTVRMPGLEDLLAEWERSDSPFFGHTRIIPRTLRTMMVEAKGSTVVV